MPDALDSEGNRLQVHGDMTRMLRKEVFKNLIFLGESGSALHGTAIEGTSDSDQTGVLIEPPEYIIGLKHFEQYTEQSQPEGERSGPEDKDLTVFSLRKWMRLARAGNPNILELLFTPENNTLETTSIGRDLKMQKDLIISKQIGHRFLGYMSAQKAGLLGERRGQRHELVQEFGYDVKYAMHAIRLGLEGVELLKTRQIVFPLTEVPWLLDVRQGKFTLKEVTEAVEDLEEELRETMIASSLQETANNEKLDTWLVAAYRKHWAGF